MKTYDIELQRLKSLRHERGIVELGIDAQVLPQAPRDEGEGSSKLRMPMDQARSLLMLLKRMVAEQDSLLPRSRRSGRS